MDAFGDNFDQAADPAADFLKREQEDLAGLEDDLVPAAAVTQPKVEGKFLILFLIKYFFCPANNNKKIIDF